MSFHFLYNIPSRRQSTCISSPKRPSQHTSQMLDTIEMLESVLNEDLFFGITLLFKKTPPRADRGLAIRTVEYDLSLAQDEITHSTFFFKDSFPFFCSGWGVVESSLSHKSTLRVVALELLQSLTVGRQLLPGCYCFLSFNKWKQNYQHTLNY